MMIVDFNKTINIWIEAIKDYDFAELCRKPYPESWSLGQVYMHIVSESNYFLSQIKICASNSENANQEMSANAKIMFVNNSFPDEIIVGPPTNALTPQPESKEQLMKELINLKDEINKADILISKSPFKGKTKHPGLNYFNASDWFKFIEMHLRHHLRQKKRIDDFLTSKNK
ncbi:MAG TPA: DinB family protein [Puia sp.]|nr:DinB family protein [Puia sp.]